MYPTATIIFSIIIFAIALACIFIGIMQFLQKGTLLNNEYLYRTKQQRSRMTREEKKPYYYQSSIIFLSLSIIFIFIGINIFLNITPLWITIYILISLLIIGAIVSTIIINKKNK